MAKAIGDCKCINKFEKDYVDIVFKKLIDKAEKTISEIKKDSMFGQTLHLRVYIGGDPMEDIPVEQYVAELKVVRKRFAAIPICGEGRK